MSEGKLCIGVDQCWERILQRLRQGEIEEETPVEKKVFTARLERSEIVIYLGAERIHCARWLVPKMVKNGFK